MIFVKETRPQIVETHPEMGALQVMQEVGKKWQALSQEERVSQAIDVVLGLLQGQGRCR